jgi:hypothetical protein
LGIVVPEQKTKVPVQAINGRCLKCGYRLAWVLVRAEKRQSPADIALRKSGWIDNSVIKRINFAEL